MCQMWVVFLLGVNPRTCEVHHVNKLSVCYFLLPPPPPPFFIHFLKLLHPDDFAAHLASNCNSYPEKKLFLAGLQTSISVRSWLEQGRVRGSSPDRTFAWYIYSATNTTHEILRCTLWWHRTTWLVLLIIVNTFHFLIILFTRTWHVKGLVSVFNSRQMFLLDIIR